MVGYNTQQLNINNLLSAMALMVIVVMFFRMVNKMLFPETQKLLPATEGSSEAAKLIEQIEDPIIRQLAWDTYQKEGMDGLRRMFEEYRDFLKPGELPQTEPGRYEYYIHIPVTYRQASTTAGRRYVRERMSEVRRRILERCPDAEIRSGFVIGTLDVKCSKPLTARDLGRGIEVMSWASTIPQQSDLKAPEPSIRGKKFVLEDTGPGLAIGPMLPQTTTYYTVSFQGDTTFKPGEIVSEQAFKAENERVIKLGLRPARGWVTSKGELRSRGDSRRPPAELEEYLPATVHPTLQKYRDLARKNPDQVDRLINRARHEKSSLILGRGFGEPFEDYLQRRPDVKARWDALTTAIEELQSGKPGLMLATEGEELLLWQ